MRQLGFSLIEVMMVIFLIAMLVVVAAPFTGAWVQDADIREVEGGLTQAIGRARALAQRNAAGITNDNPVSAICINRNVNRQWLTVLQATAANAPPDCLAAGGAVGIADWTTDLDRDVVITNNGANVDCVCFNNRGLLTNAGCAACAVSTTFVLASGGAGGRNETVSIY